jgi:hypothetical protein
MVTKVYSHILDEDRKVNAQKFDEMFYRQKQNSSDLDARKIMALLADNPAVLNDLKDLLIKNAG